MGRRRRPDAPGRHARRPGCGGTSREWTIRRSAAGTWGMSRVVPGAQPPYSSTSPPGRAIETAACQASGRPTASTTADGPRPSPCTARRASMAAVSRGASMARAAPKRIARSRRASCGSHSVTTHPRTASRPAISVPCVPPPSTTTSSPSPASTRSTPRTAHAKGSTIAARSGARPPGTGSRLRDTMGAGTRRYSA